MLDCADGRFSGPIAGWSDLGLAAPVEPVPRRPGPCVLRNPPVASFLAAASALALLLVRCLNALGSRLDFAAAVVWYRRLGRALSWYWAAGGEILNIVRQQEGAIDASKIAGHATVSMTGSLHCGAVDTAGRVVVMQSRIVAAKVRKKQRENGEENDGSRPD